MNIIRRPKLRKKIPLSDSSVDRLEAEGDFPKRVQLSDKSIGWIEEEVDEWLLSRQRGVLPPPNSLNRADAA